MCTVENGLVGRCRGRDGEECDGGRNGGECDGECDGGMMMMMMKHTCTLSSSS